MGAYSRRGVTRIELVVAVVVIGLAMLFFMMSLTRGGGPVRRAQCLSNMRNIGLALMAYQNFNNHFPNAGTFYDDPAVHQGDPLKSTIYQAILNPGSHAEDADGWLHSLMIHTFQYLDIHNTYTTIGTNKNLTAPGRNQV